METYTLDFSRIGGLTDEQFYMFCQSNKQLKMERNAHGEIFIMALTGGATGIKNSRINLRLGNWSLDANLGQVFDSSTGFTLPDKAVRSPDAAFVRQERWNAISPEQRKKFVPLCPDFVIELMSEHDYVNPAQAKMQEWMENGCQLAWLINAEAEETYIYRGGQEMQTVRGFETILSGEDILPDFTLNLAELR